MKQMIANYQKHRALIRLILTSVSGAFLLVSLILQLTGHSLPYFDFAYIAILFCGVPILVGAAVGLIRDHDVTADVLVSLAIIGSLILKEYFAAGEVAFIMQVGSILEDFTSAKARSGIAKLIKLTPKTARIVKDGTAQVVPVEAVKLGDTLSVLAGETIPVDGVILEGHTSIDEAVMTGESLPLEKGPGDAIISGTLNQFGTFTYRASKEEKDSALQRMILLAKTADAEKAPIISRADRWAAWMVLVSTLSAIITLVVVGYLHNDYWLGFQRAVTVLVVFCPCAFVLATPTAVMAGIGNATKKGILIRSGDALERFAHVDTISFDKTGTLTLGKPSIIAIVSSLSSEELLGIAASLEVHSEHPLGKAIVAAYGDKPKRNCGDFEVMVGVGVKGRIDGDVYEVGKVGGAGKEQFAEQEKRDSEKGATLIYVNEEGVCLGYIALADTLKDDAAKTIGELKEEGIHPILLTGDKENAASRIARSVGISDYHSSCLPEDKMRALKELDKAGHHCCMVGDGVNDALALKSAYASVAMGALGSDIAVESSDAVLVKDDLKSVPYLFDISRRTLRKITINIIISMSINFAAVFCAVMGYLDPVWGAVVHNTGSVLVVLNSLLLLFYAPKKKQTMKVEDGQAKSK
jgi:heavy metal translocating P-type ATPase